MKKVIILKGLPASGKSTYAKELIDKNPEKYKRINKDELRLMLDNNHWSKANEKFILKIRNDLICQALIDHKSVIIDDTNLHPKHEQAIRKIVDEWNKTSKDNVQVEIQFFDTPIEECIKRDLKRQNSVGEDVIRRMYSHFLKKPIEKYENNNNLPEIILCDIDGTLALHTERSPFEFDKLETDALNKPIANIIKFYSIHGIKIILLSGRQEEYKTQTEKWLASNSVDYYQLYMRKKDDRRQDDIVKKELFDEYIRDNYYVKFVLDDRDRVVELWRSMGLTCLQVNYGNF